MAGSSRQPDRDADDLEAPRLGEAMKALYRAEIPVPLHRQETILNLGRHRLRNVRRFRTLLRWGGGVAAAAALVLVALQLWEPIFSRRPAMPLAAVAGDINRDGRVDILDAYLLARQVQDGRPARAAGDVTGDGLVDAHDVDRVAQQAVSLTGGPLQ